MQASLLKATSSVTVESNLEEQQETIFTNRSNNSREELSQRLPAFSIGGGGGGSFSSSSNNDSLQWFEDFFKGGQGEGSLDFDFGDFDFISIDVFESITDMLVEGIIGDIAEDFGEAIGGAIEGAIGGLFEF
jgi:hypothetical protein